MANPEHVEVVRQGAEAIVRWREQHPGQHLDLSEADLSEANLREADLTEADLSEANLNKADLTAADLNGANLSRASMNEVDLTAADLNAANLTGAYLSRAILKRADLSRAILRGAHLSQTILIETKLSRANLSQVRCLSTVFDDCDLSQAIGLESVEYRGPSKIDTGTLMRSFKGAGNKLTAELETFFLGTGVPTELLSALPRMVAEVRYCSAFICYGEPDRAFAEKLVNDLRAKGVSSWIYALDATPGERTWRQIGEKRREAEKMVVLCSDLALRRDPVLKEIEEQIDEDPDKMVPVSLDDDWKHPGFRVMRGIPGRDLKPFLLDRNYADFSDPSSYEEALERLLKGLERKES